MKKRNFRIILISLLLLHPFLGGIIRIQDKRNLVNKFGKIVGRIDVGKYFKRVDLEDMDIVVNSLSLGKQIEEVLDYYTNFGTLDSSAVHAGVLSELGITLKDMESTLRFIKHTIDGDIKSKRTLRILDPQFIKSNFNIIQWFPFKGNGNGNKIKVTKYAVFTVNGRKKKDSIYKYALYRLPNDEKGLSVEEARAQRFQLDRFKYSKQQVLAGAYEKGGAQPLAWLTRKGLEEALLNGALRVRFANGEQKLYNVNRSNEIPYDPTIQNPYNQRRYWYFESIRYPQGYGRDARSHLTIYPGAALAGDVFNLGLGQLMGIALKEPGNIRPKIHLSILADTGGIFTPNLFQIDFYVGVVGSRAEFNYYAGQIPDYAKVFFLIKKR
jgi:hypothetical protein